MAYTESNLLPGESVIYKAKYHWAVFIRPAVWFLVGLLMLRDMTMLGELLMLIGVVVLIRAGVTFWCSEFAVTNKRIISKAGLITTKSFEILLAKIEGVVVDRPLLGTMLGYGTIKVTGTGGSIESFPNIATPLELRTKIHEQISNTQAQPSAAIAAPIN